MRVKKNQFRKMKHADWEAAQLELFDAIERFLAENAARYPFSCAQENMAELAFRAIMRKYQSDIDAGIARPDMMPIQVAVQLAEDYYRERAGQVAE